MDTDMLKIFDSVDYKINDRIYKLTNICEAYVLKRLNIDKTYLYQDEIISDMETLESLSQRFYGTPKYYWIIMIVNNIVSGYGDLPMSHDLLVDYARAKHDTTDKVHHFMDTRIDRYTDDVDSTEYQRMLDDGEQLPHYILPVSALDFEIEQNNKRSRIKIVNPAFISTFEQTFKGLINES